MPESVIPVDLQKREQSIMLCYADDRNKKIICVVFRCHSLRIEISPASLKDLCDILNELYFRLILQSFINKTNPDFNPTQIVDFYFLLYVLHILTVNIIY